MLDPLLALVAAAAALTGWRRGGTARALRLAGLLLGLVAGLRVADVLTTRVSPVVHLALGVACACGGALVGRALGRRVGTVTGRAVPGVLDRAVGAATRFVVVGAVLAAAATVAVDAGALPRASAPAGTSAVSAAAAALGRAAPSDVEALVPASGTRLPSAATVAAVSSAVADRVLLVDAQGCAGGVVGTGFVAAAAGGAAFVVTNAHVVHGADRVTAAPSGGAERDAVPVLVDARADLAVLRVDGLDTVPLALAPADATNGSPAVTVGFPLGGPRTAVPAAVEQRLPIRGAGFAAGIALHQAYRVRAAIRHGDSGSPLLDPAGRVVGVVNALLDDHPDQGYAVTVDELRPDLAAALARPPSAPSVAAGTC